LLRLVEKEISLVKYKSVFSFSKGDELAHLPDIHTCRNIHEQAHTQPEKGIPLEIRAGNKKNSLQKQNRKKINIKRRIGNGNSQRKEYGEILAGKKNRIKKIKKKKKIKRQIGNGTNADESHTTTLQLRIESQNTKTYLQ